MLTAGLLTYPLYLVHENVGLVLFEHLPDLNRWILLGAVIAIVTAIAWGTHLLIERPLAPRLRRTLTQHRPGMLPIDLAEGTSTA
jgi:peptidoglycan/LPS O-acetylase OafA/YrhL